MVRRIVAFALLAALAATPALAAVVTESVAARAAAEKVTGDPTVAPLPGAQIFTVLSTVAVQVCADALLRNAKKNRRQEAMSEDARSGFTGIPIEHKVRRSAPIIWHGHCLKKPDPCIAPSPFS